MTSLKREEALKVFVRVRPPIYKEVKLENAVMVRGNQSIAVSTENKEISCNYDYIFGELAEQQQIFEKIQPVLIDVLSGINGCIFCYGQTSSGKSFTMIGPNGGQEILQMERSEWGILPRAAEFLLNYLNDKSEEGLLTFEAKASFLQIYNENLYDLLRDSGPKIEDHLILNEKEKENELKIREVPKPKSLALTYRENQVSEVYVSGLSEFRVQTCNDVIRILAIGTSNRMTRSTDFNLTSSRSHAILQLTFEIETQIESGQTLMSRSKLYLVDLAGSEKIPYVSTDNPKHIKELTSINKSLSALGNVISALATTNRPHIPYRESKLTRILQDSLGGNTRTVLIACVAPTIVHSTETLSTLQFADRAKNVKVTVKANTVVDDKVTLAKAQAEITRLKALLGHALKQLEEKSNGLGISGIVNLDTLQLSEDNEKLRRENQSLKKLLKSGGNGFQPLPTIDRAHVAPGRGRGRSVSPTASEPEERSKKKAAFMSGVDRFGRPSFDNVGNYLKAAGKLKKMNNLREQHSDYDSDNDSEVQRKSKYAGPQSAKRLKPIKKKKSGEEDGHQEKQKNSHHSSMYKAINDRQVAELNILLEEANRKLQEQYLDSMTKAMQNAEKEKSTSSSNPETKSSHSSTNDLPKPEDMSETVQSQILKVETEIQRPQNPPNPTAHPQFNQPPSIQSPNDPLPNHPYNPDPYYYQQPPSNQNPPSSHGNSGSERKPYPGAPNFPQPQNNYPDQSDVVHIARQQSNALTQEKEQPNNRIFIRKGGAPGGPGGGASSGNAPIPTEQNSSRIRNPLPPVIESNSSVAHSANLFANAVHMYNNVNRFAQVNKNHAGGGNGYPPVYPQNQQHQQNLNSNNHLSQGFGDDSHRNNNSNNYGNNNSSNNSNFYRQGREPPQQQNQPSPQYLPPLQQQQLPIHNNNNNNNNNNSNSVNKPLSPLNKNPAIPLPHQHQNPGNQNPNHSINGFKPTANLSFTMDDVGRAIEMFSFRLNVWERIDLIDFEPTKRQFKVQFGDGSIQWLDLSKKPTRSLHDEVNYR